MSDPISSSPIHSTPGGMTYLLAEKNGVLVVSFVGHLKHENIAVLEKCREEIASKNASWVILSFRDVPETLDQRILPELMQLQKSIRDKPAKLRISSLHPELRKFMESRELIRKDELVNNLAEALHALQQDRAKAA